MLVMVGCQRPNPSMDINKNRVDSFIEKTLNDVKYDPYTGKIYFNQSLIQSDWVSLCENAHYVDSNFYPYRWSDYATLPGTGIEDEAFRRDLFDQMNSGRGWGIVQLSHPKAGLMHGDYEVSFGMLVTITWSGDSLYGGQFWATKTITGKKAEPAAQSPANKQPPADIKDRLKKLKEMFDANIITKEEYQEKRKAILGDF